MNLEYIELSRSKRVSQWLRQRLSGTFALDTRYLSYSIASLWLISCAAVAISAMGMPTGLGVLFDLVTALSLNTIAMALSSSVVAGLLAIAGLKIPRFTASSLLYVGVLTYFILYFSEFGVAGSVIFCVIFSVLAASAGLLVGLLVFNWRRKGVRVGTTVIAVILALSTLYVTSGATLSLSIMSNSNASTADDSEGADDSDRGEVRSLSALTSDPSEPGGLSYNYFTYGSGQDRHREEFGDQTALLSQPSDASTYIQDWSWLRSKFWGFDETELPLNGRVWMPEGEGPFPLVLMVHGNHLMEKFSDEGYGYLGELLASRGMAAVSIDENFLNYSVWSGIPDEDMKARAWLLLKHVQQLQEFARLEGTPLYGKVDFQQLAMLGHSRGGQAVAMAADREYWFEDADGLPSPSSYDIQAVIAIAPTDTVVDNKQTQLEGVSYLALQGAKDADLVNFYGDRQYWRTEVSRAGQFKASLYIADANHSKFNTAWGESDQSLPVGLFVRPKDVLGSEQQRQIAKVYVSAFLETVFHDSRQYERLFRDYRTGLDFLPKTDYLSQYQNGSYRSIAVIEGENREAPSPGIRADAVNLSDWRLIEAFDREGKGKGYKGVVLGWKNAGAYTMNMNPELVAGMGEEDILMFSMASLEMELEEEAAITDTNPGLEIELEDQSGTAVRLPLEAIVEEGLFETDFTWLPGMETVLSKGKYKNSGEPIFQAYELRLSKFKDMDSSFDAAKLSKLTFYFSNGPGKVMINNVGWMTQ